MPDAHLHHVLADEAATRNLAARVAPRLQAGDTLLLEGPIGAGKTAFARAVIRSRLARDEDVPSPTFTLVQTYEDTVPIWHADLYRLSDVQEVLELGLDEAFETAICLVEWPDRLGPEQPQQAITLTFDVLNTGRRVTASARSEGQSRLEAIFAGP